MACPIERVKESDSKNAIENIVRNGMKKRG
jgi:hypothetical protein